ncbi:MAG: uroporphyrinogen decarboxylase family protein [Phycisphaeraceae bacterium]
MTGRQRILAALRHEPVDRVPIDLGGTRQSGISVFAYQSLLDALRIDRVPRVFDLYQLLATIDAEVADRFASDTVLLQRSAVAFGLSNERYRAFQLRDLQVEVPEDFQPIDDGQGGLKLQRDGRDIAHMPAKAFYFDRFEKYPGATHPDLNTWRPPRPGAPGAPGAPGVGDAELEHYACESRRLFEETDKAVIVAMGPPYELFNGIGQGGFEDWMMTFATEDAYVDQLYTLLVDQWLGNLQHLHESVKDRVQVLQIADDFGTQGAPFLSTEMFRRKLLPHYRRGLDWIHANTDWFVLLHSDGAIAPLLDSIIEMGVDAINPVQTSAAGMDPATLHRQFGDRITFWGGSGDSQGTLTNGSAQDVAAETRRHLDAFHPLQGGYVFASVHNIQANVPARNIIALFDTAIDYPAQEHPCP